MMEEIILNLKNACREISILMRETDPFLLSQLTDENNNSGDDVKSLDLLSNTILKNYLLKYNCRTFVMFDCCNTKVDCKFKYNYNAKKMELV